MSRLSKGSGEATQELTSSGPWLLIPNLESALFQFQVILLGEEGFVLEAVRKSIPHWTFLVVYSVCCDLDTPFVKFHFDKG